jgi:hypothetical protein
VDLDQNVTISRADVAALIGLTSNVEAFVRLGGVDVSAVAQTKIQRRLARDLNVDDTAPLGWTAGRPHPASTPGPQRGRLKDRF